MQRTCRRLEAAFVEHRGEGGELAGLEAHINPANGSSESLAGSIRPIPHHAGMSLAFAQGFATSAALIVAIGAQNAFVLRQGLRREHVGAVVAVCALSDLLLISLGVAGLGALVQGHATLLLAARWGGALFLAAYGALAARRALSPHALAAGDGVALTRRQRRRLPGLHLAQPARLARHRRADRLARQPARRRGRWFAAGAGAATLVWFPRSATARGCSRRCSRDRPRGACSTAPSRGHVRSPPCCVLG